jgi:O-antigen/teichoic acid export membrane protein
MLGCGTIALWLYSPATWKGLIGESPQETVVYWMLVPMLLAGGLSLAFQAWLVRTRSFAAISRCTIVSAAAGAIVKIIGGIVNASAFTLVVAHTTAAFFSASLLAAASLRSLLPLNDQKGSLGAPARLSPTALALAYRGFPLYTMPRDLLNGISAGFPVVMFATFGDIATSGLYGLARTVVSVPASLVTQSLATALLPHLAGISQTNRSLRPPLLKAMAALALVGLPIFGPLFFAAPALFRFIFGADWEPAGQYAQWLSLWSYCTFIDLPCAQAVRFLGLQRAFLVHELVATFGRLAAVYGGLVWLRDPIHSVMLLSLVGVVANLVLVLWVLPFASRSQQGAVLPAAQHSATDAC